jgi:hypothetical protein
MEEGKSKIILDFIIKNSDIIAGFDQELFNKLPQSYKNRMVILIRKTR